MSELPENCGTCHYESACEEGDHFYCSNPDSYDMIIENPTVAHPDCPLKDEILDAKRFRVKYKNENLYVVVATMEGMPREVFVQHATYGRNDLQFMMASWDSCTRLCSMALKQYPLEKVIRQLEKSSRSKNDLPGILSEKLKTWIK